MLVELLRPAGAELARRWLACLLLAPEGERRAIVEAVEARMAEAYGPASGQERASEEPAEGEREINVVGPPVQREGYVEQVVTTYTKAPPTPGKVSPGSPRAKEA